MVKKQIELPPVFIGAQPPTGDFSLGGWTIGTPPPMPEAFRFAPFMNNELTKWAGTFNASLALIDASLEQELAAGRTGFVEVTNTVTKLEQELALRESLMARKIAEVNQVSAAADQFYGVDPLSLNPNEQMKIIVERMKHSSDLSDVHKFAQYSHEAAYKRRFANEMIARLNEQSITIRGKLAELQAQAAQAAAQAAEAAAQAAAAAAAQEAQRLIDEQLRNEIAANTFRADGHASASHAQILFAAGTISAGEGATFTLQAAIRASVAGLTDFAMGTASGFLVGVSALVYSSRLGNGELPGRYVVTLPLTNLGPAPITDLNAVALNSGTIDVPFRLASRPGEAGLSEVIVVPTDGVHVPANVRVVAAIHKVEQNLYSASTAHVPPRTFTWTPIVNPDNSSTATPIEQPPTPIYEGAAFIPVQGRIDVYPELADVSIDDYILIFPDDSGIPPLYVVFQSPRDMSGVASGEGQQVAPGWLEASAEGEGSPVPSQIAAQLRGREFNNFSRFREAFWRQVAADEILANQFSPNNVALMSKGYAPHVLKSQRAGERKVFEIHHVNHISNGGAVYDVDNMWIVTPKSHIKLHSEVKNG